MTNFIGFVSHIVSRSKNTLYYSVVHVHQNEKQFQPQWMSFFFFQRPQMIYVDFSMKTGLWGGFHLTQCKLSCCDETFGSGLQCNWSYCRVLGFRLQINSLYFGRWIFLTHPDWQNSSYRIWNTYEENPTRSLLQTKVGTYLGCLMIHATYDTEINVVLCNWLTPINYKEYPILAHPVWI